MALNLTEENIKNFIEKYGNNDIYFGHYYDDEGKLVVQYFPNLTTFVDETSIPAFKADLIKNPHLQEQYLNEIILTDNYAYIPADPKSSKNPLVKNFTYFLQELSSKKYYKKTKFCKPDNLKKGAPKFKEEKQEKTKSASEGKQQKNTRQNVKNASNSKEKVSSKRAAQKGQKRASTHKQKERQR